jgi:leader peptidase (prepilin peptidase)/N-methyltransferase
VPDIQFVELWVFVFGALFGSFANMLIVRVPKGENIVLPASHCDSCGKALKWYHNIPLLSCLVLRAKCAFCKKSFGWRHFWVELIMASLFLSVVSTFGFSWLSLEYLIFVFGLVVISFIDFDHRIIPDSFSLGGIVVGLIGAYLNPQREFMDAFWGFLVGGGFLFAIAYAYLLLRKVEGMGGGDIKLLGWIGAVLGFKSIFFVVFVSSILGSIVGIAIMIKSKDGLKSSLPFGPYLALAAILYMFFGTELLSWYLNAFFPWLQPSS